jgi:selenocysteine lyase/cysteine desulfurase
VLDVHALRARFPALAASDAAFLDGPAGSQVPREVADAMRDQLLAGTANDGGAFAT